MKANAVYKLSKSVATDGRSEILLYITVNRGNRIQIKSGLSVNPKYFKGELKSNGYIVGNVVMPQSKFDIVGKREVSSIIDELNTFTSYALRLCELSGENVTKEELVKNIKLIQNENRRRGNEKGERDDISVSSITDHLLNVLRKKEEAEKDHTEKNMFVLAEIYLTKKNFSYDHTKAFRVLMRALNRYELFLQMTDEPNFKLDIDRLNKSNIEDFEDYLRNEYDLSISPEYKKIFKDIISVCPADLHTARKTPKIEERGENTIMKLKKKFKAFYKWLNENGHTSNNPFTGIKIGSEIYGTPVYITIEEREQLARFDLSKNKPLETQRDIFIFQCLIGCRVSDLYKLTKANIENGILEYVPHKTKDEASESQVKPRIPLSAQAQALIKKYKGKDKQGRLFPFISSQKYNEAIKKAFVAAGITRNVSVRNPTTGEIEIKPINEIASSHMARRAFVGNIYKEVQDQAIISKMSGHVEGSRAFSRYRAIDDDILKSVINKVNKHDEKEDLSVIDSFLSNLSEEQKAELLQKLSKK